MALPSYLFWLDWVKKIIWDSFWWVFLMLVVFWVPFLRVWWWVFFPFFLSMQLKTLYLWWISWDFAYAKEKWTMLEIIPPKEVLIPFKAMEDVFSIVWPIYDSANFREMWCDGELDNAPYWMSWEMTSIEGKIHFYARVLQQHRSIVESALYAHYPEIEIHEVSDYTKNAPPNTPNEEWDVYGEDFILRKPSAYPIKTYEKFFEPQGERISAEEKRVDPMMSLLESMSKLGPGEQFWLQYIMLPITDRDDPWKKEAKKIIAEISRRPEKKEKSLVEELREIADQVIFGPQKEGSGASAKYKWVDPQKTETEDRELLLTPGEREILSEVENKIKKAVYRVVTRGVYVAKREDWSHSNRVLTRSYLSHFGTQNLNFFGFEPATRPKVHYLWRKRRQYLRSRRMFRNYVLRFPPGFPDRGLYCAILNTEEMATIFHFPVKITGLVSPTTARVEFKKAGAPPNLPTE
jgi:hypothetical protein